MFNTIFYAFLSVSLLGAFFGVGLAIASKYLYVKKEEKLTILEESLPGLNCGACGFAGCSSYAEAIFNGSSEDLTLCSPGGPETASRLAELMGVSVDLSKEKMIAQVHCKGGREETTVVFNYDGIKDCNAAYSLYQGSKSCKYGCIGFGSCVRVCPVDAIRYDDNGLVVVDKDICISCGKCVDICPNGVMKMIPYSADYMVACNSKDKGAFVRKACKVGCIGCKICEKKSPDGGFAVENFLAEIDYSANGDRSEAAAACPVKCIIKNI